MNKTEAIQLVYRYCGANRSRKSAKRIVEKAGSIKNVKKWAKTQYNAIDKAERDGFFD